jgi:hypothetical protein
MISLVEEDAGDVSVCVDIPDWAFKEQDGSELIFGCADLEREAVCKDGGQGPAFDDIFEGLWT